MLTVQKNLILLPYGIVENIKKRNFHLFTSQNIILTYLFKLISFQQIYLPAGDKNVKEIGNI